MARAYTLSLDNRIEHVEVNKEEGVDDVLILRTTSAICERNLAESTPPEQAEKPLSKAPAGTATLVTAGDIENQFEKSKNLSWSAYIKGNPIHHTGILVNLDDEGFTIDFGPVWASLLPRWMVADSTRLSKLKYIRHDNASMVSRVTPIQHFDLTDEAQKSNGKNVLDALCKPFDRPYRLIDTNCRHHVKYCLDAVEAVNQVLGIEFDIASEDVKKVVESLMFGKGATGKAKDPAGKAKDPDIRHVCFIGPMTATDDIANRYRVHPGDTINTITIRDSGDTIGTSGHPTVKIN